MNKRRSPQTFWHLFLVSLLGAPLITPLLRWTAVPCTHDGHLHYHRIAALRHAWENGLFFSRWLPDLAFGYGYPYFIFREPIPLYAGLFPHLLGLPLSAAENLLYILAILAGGWFMFLWVRDIFRERSGIISAVAYMAAPYILIDALIRGNAPESVALPLFPFLLWMGRRWLLKGTAETFVLGVLGLVILSLSHNISLLLFSPLLLLYLLAIGLIYRLERRQIIARLALLFGLGLGTTIFYTGGALLEMGQVTLQQSTTTRNNDFHFNFASLEEIMAPVSPEDPTLINPPLPFRLGWAPSLLALLGLTRLFWQRKFNDSRVRRERSVERLKIEDPTSVVNRQSSIVNREQRWHIILMGVATAVFLFLALPQSLFLWENVPLVDFIQFPWRMVGRAALPVAFLAGVPFASWQVNKAAGGKHLRITDYGLRITFFAAITILIIEVFPILYPTMCQEEPFPTINTVHNYERFSGLVGVDPEGSYFPRTVQRRPRESDLEADYLAGQMPQRFDTAVLPPGATVAIKQQEPLAATIQVDSPRSFNAQFLSFAFPGWAALVDGRSVPIVPSQPEGLITFPVSAGEHSITVRWQSTPLRTALLGLSIMMLSGFVVTAFVLTDSRRGGTARNPLGINKPSSPRAVSPSPQMNHVILLILGFVLLGFKLLVVDKIETPLRQVGTPAVNNPAMLQAAELRFDGYNLSRTSLESGGTFDIDMAWTAVSPPTADYQSNVWLVGPDGLIWSEKGTERPRLYEEAPPSRQWLPGHWAWDSREVQVFAGTPPGQYDIILTLFDKATLQPITLLADSGGVVGPTAVIGQIELTRPNKPAEIKPQYEMDTAVADLTLLGYNQDRSGAAPGEQVLLTLFWVKPANPPSAVSVIKVQLANEEGVVQETWEIPPVRPDYPPAEWQPGERLRGQHLLRLPAGLESGSYQFELNGTSLGKIVIQAPDRIFEQPDVENLVNVPFYDADGTHLVTLIGYTIIFPQPLSLKLVWQAQSEMSTSYRVFVHEVDGGGQIIAQSDGEPAGWTRPTTGWMAGEYILDQHSSLLSLLPDDTPAVRIGLYDSATGQRLLTDQGDFVTLILDHP